MLRLAGASRKSATTMAAFARWPRSVPTGMQRRACEGVRRHQGRGNAGISLGPHRPACTRVFPKVYVDAGLATHNLGSRAPALLAEALELAPYRTFLCSSDASGLPGLYDLGVGSSIARCPTSSPPACRRSLYRTNRGAPDQEALRRKRRTCPPARRPDVTAVSAGAAGLTPAPLKLG